jgi:hypothetical protein
MHARTQRASQCGPYLSIQALPASMPPVLARTLLTPHLHNQNKGDCSILHGLQLRNQLGKGTITTLHLAKLN